MTTRRDDAPTADPLAARQLEEIARIAHIGAFAWDIATNTVTWTDELYRIYGQEPQSFGATFEAFLAQIHEDDRETVRGIIGDAVERGGEFRMQERIVRPDGEIRYLSSRGEVQVDDTGVPVRLVGICQDVTEQHEHERDLASSRAELLKFRALVEASDDLIGIGGLDGSVVYVNPAGRRLVGIDADDDVTVRSIDDFLDEEARNRSYYVHVPALLEQGSFHGESTLQNMQTGELIPVELSSFVMHDIDSNKAIGYGTVQRDLRQQRLAEQQLAELHRERQALLAHIVEVQEAERRRIAADIHDDTIQVLTAADLRLGMLSKQLANQGSDQIEPLETIRNTVREATIRLRNLIFDIESPAYDQPLRFSIVDCLDRVLLDSGIDSELSGDLDADLPPPTRLVAYRICQEALINVRTHSGAGRVVVTLDSVDGGTEVAIADDGVGVDPDTVRSPAGHFGLTSMRERATMAGGWWRIERGEPGGAVVRFWLPRAAAAAS
jgi:PAS domain S-box-containing protein